MMTRAGFALLLVILNASIGYSQEYDSDSVYYTPIPKTQNKSSREEVQLSKQVEYFFNIQTGGLVGCNDCSKGKEFTFSASTMHGVAIGKRFRTGIAIGFDSYLNWQTLPLFGIASWDLIGNKSRNALFVQMAYGWAHPWFVRDGAYSNYTVDPFSAVSGGRMINPQIGYRLKYYNMKVGISIGYKFQRIFYRSQNYYYCPACDFQQPPLNEVTQDMNRMQLIMSVGWK